MTGTTPSKVLRIAPILLAFAAPLLAAAVAVAILDRQTAQRHDAEAVLLGEIQRLDTALSGIARFDRIHVQYLARHIVDRELERERGRAVQLLNLIGALPADVRLERASLQGGDLVLAGVTHSPQALSNAIVTLETTQAWALDRAERRPDAAGGERFAIHARRSGPAQ